MVWRVKTAMAGVVLAAACIGNSASAQPSSGWVGDGRDDFLKGQAVDILKAMMPGAEFTFNTADFVLDPLVTVATTPGTYDVKLDAWLKAMVQAGVNAQFPAYGIALNAGKVVIGGSIYTTEQMLAAAQDQQLQAILTGAGTGGLLDRVNNVTADTPFIDNPYIKNQGITPENLGQKVGSEADLRRLWYTTYGGQLRDLYGRGNATEVLDAGWPKVLELWKAQYVTAKIPSIISQLDTAIPKVQQQLAERASQMAGASGNDADAITKTIAGGQFIIPQGTYIDIYTNSVSTITVYRTSTSISGIEEWATGGRAGTNVWSNCVITTVLTCNWRGDYRLDPDKSGIRTGTLTAQLNGNQLVGTQYENEPQFNWNVPPYESSMRAGAQWPINHTKQDYSAFRPQ
jgi:hypothetical protein